MWRPTSWRLVATFSLCVLCLARPPAQAQHLGIVGGITNAKFNVSGDEPLNKVFATRPGPIGGLLFAVDLGDQLSLDVEALANIRGTGFDATRGPSYDVRLTYVDIPVMLRLTPPANSPVRWIRLIAGGYASRLLRARARPTTVGQTLDVINVIQSGDAGWIAGFGVAAAGFDLDLRYVGGTLNLSTERDLGIGLVGTNDNPLTFRTRAFVLLARRRLW